MINVRSLIKVKLKTRLKIIKIYEKYKNIAIIFSVLIIIIFLFKVKPALNSNLNLNSINKLLLNTTFVAIISSLLGSIVGGIISFLVMINGQNRQLEGRYLLNKRDVIYIPLYNELVKVRNVLKENKYPSLFEFEIDKPIIRQPWEPREPRFVEWNQIKNDIRYIQVPKDFRDSLELYIETIREYLKKRPEAVINIHDKINAILDEELHIKNAIVVGQIKDNLLNIIEKFKQPGSLLKYYLQFTTRKASELSEEQIRCIDMKIHNECNNLISVKNLVKLNDYENNQLYDLIDYLYLVIDMLNKKYESSKNIF